MQNIPQGTLQVKFGDQLLQGKYTVVPNLLLKLLGELDITPNELVFTLEVWVYWHEQQKEMFPALNIIAEGIVNIFLSPDEISPLVTTQVPHDEVDCQL